MLNFLSALVGVLWAMTPGGPAQPVLPVGRIQTDEPVVAITFDACATRTQGYTFDRAIYDIIKREGLRATIFLSGSWIDFHPDVMQELATDSKVEFGDHSYDHPHMADLPRTRILAEIDRTEAAFARFGRRGIAFRPPYGEWSPQLIRVAAERQLVTVTWDVVSGDPSGGVTVESMVQTVVGKARPGSIIIFHINGRGWNTGQALPLILRGLRERGFQFVFLSELFAYGPRPRAPSAMPSMTVGRPVRQPIITENPYGEIRGATPPP
jgi:peptidoglycan/xylan/chitin deacetylase (PgdA/CDA1 family)